ncbi:RNA-directed DNA polymerase, eukaryota, reverse transcriptase zinc-binding domain protein [Tanacetum coccineum]
MPETLAKEPKISIKAIVDKEKNRVLYVEADYTFVDILFSFMTLPMGTIVRLLGEQADKKCEALGSLNNLYQSLVDLPESYFFIEECKLMLLNPRSPSLLDDKLFD